MTNNMPTTIAIEEAFSDGAPASAPVEAQLVAVILPIFARAIDAARRQAIEEAAQHQETLAGNPTLRKREADLIRALAEARPEEPGP